MNIEYKETKEFKAEELQDLFLSVNWKSGKYPDKLVKAMKNSSHVIAAYDNDKLVGLVRSLDDGETVAFIHYLLINPSYQDFHIGTELMTRLL
ncbi:MAG: GNAT family N-acetyltransferase, partial [Clostridium sp.]|nr:GNAT family N-acetyltransferase [Clostridium sp.]